MVKSAGLSLPSLTFNFLDSAMDVEEEDTVSSGEFGFTKPSPMKRSRSGVGEEMSENPGFADTMPNP